MIDILEIVNNIQDKSKELIFPIPGWEGANYLNTDRYHAWLATYIKEYSPRRVLELGRRWGNSLYSMSYFLPDSSILDSYDIQNIGNVINKPNVNILVYNGDYSKIDLSLYEFIFVDINGFGIKELEIYNQAVSQGFKGVIAWDDVGNKWCPDKDFWDKLPEENKCKAPLHGAYFGITLHN